MGRVRLGRRVRHRHLPARGAHRWPDHLSATLAGVSADAPAVRPAYVAVLHFDRPFKHARHALVVTSDLARLATHPPHAHRLLRRVHAAGIGWTITASVRCASHYDATTLRRHQSHVTRKRQTPFCPRCKPARRRAIVPADWAWPVFSGPPAPILARLEASQDPAAPEPD